MLRSRTFAVSAVFSISTLLFSLLPCRELQAQQVVRTEASNKTKTPQDDPLVIYDQASLLKLRIETPEKAIIIEKALNKIIHVPNKNERIALFNKAIVKLREESRTQQSGSKP